MYNPYDHYFKKAQKSWYKARSAFKLEEIDQKFDIFWKNVSSLIDIWCSPGSWLQYADQKLTENYSKSRNKVKPIMIWFDLKTTQPISDFVFTYKQDIEEKENVTNLLNQHNIQQVDIIMSDMAPDTTWSKSIDAMKSIWLIESTLRMYEKFLKPDWKFVIKVFMWPGFDQLCNDLKKIYWPSHIRIFKPKACRKNSKETYIVKV